MFGNGNVSLTENCKCNTLQEHDQNLSHSMTKEQYNQLLSPLGSIQIQGENTTNGYSKSVDNLVNGHGAVNLVGILTCHSSITEIDDLSCNCVKMTADT